ncbi:MAG: P-loop NTPase fold protein [Gammaproteobacteria bacterium]|nr:P-loop NTPase fold protein [Gammaproteobacteria bacterium]
MIKKIGEWVGRPRRNETGDSQRREGGAFAGDHPNEPIGRIVPVRSDSPIRRLEDDALGRTEAARSFARDVLTLDAAEGVVVGVLGPWGSGKTSFVNLARTEFERLGTQVLDINPWMFSGTRQLVELFLSELSAQLRVRPGLSAVAKGIAEYGEALSAMAWLPMVGPWIERGRVATRVLAQVLPRRKEGLASRRGRLEELLAKLDEPIVVVLDDIDRLSTSEIRDVFKLVRLTGSFPNIVYVVAFDRSRVEQALLEQGVPGRDYLEKILQVAVDIPAVSVEVLSRQVFAAIEGALKGIDKPGPFSQTDWPDLYVELIRPFVRNMRDVRRYAMAVRGTVAALRGQVALADVLALEGIRVFAPDLFARLHGSVAALTTTSESVGEHEPADLKVQVEAVMAAGRDQANIGRSMIRRLFPAAERHLPGGSLYGSQWERDWLKERRVAHEDVLRLYLERVAGDSLQAFYEAERLFRVLGDRGAVEASLRAIDLNRVQEVIESLENYEEQFTPAHVIPAATVLLNLVPDLPEKELGMFEFDAATVVRRVAYRLLRALKSPEAVLDSVQRILPELTTLSSKLILITLVGHRERAGHRLVSEEADKALLKSWREEVRGAPVKQLVGEWHLLQVLQAAKFEAEASEPTLDLAESGCMTIAVLRAARGEASYQSLDSRAVRRFPRLDWDVLVELYGDEHTLGQRVDAAKAVCPSETSDVAVVDLAERYLSGWRPKELGDD